MINEKVISRTSLEHTSMKFEYKHEDGFTKIACQKSR